MLSSGSARLLVAAVASVVLLLPALADATTIEGVPLSITLNGIGQMLVGRTGLPGPDFDTSTRAGACVIVEPGFPIGSCGNFPTNISPPVITGSGTQGDPFQLKDTWGLSNIEVTETLTYVNGDNFFDATYAIKNTAGVEQKFRTMLQGNLSHAGSTLGQGSYDPVPPAALFGYNDDRGSFGGIVAGPTPWDSFEESDWASFPLMHAGLSNTYDPDLVDDWIGVEYHQYVNTGLPAGDTATVEATWVFGSYAGLSLNASAASLQAGQPETITATSLAQGLAVAGRPVRYTVTGANPSSGTALTGPDGTARWNLAGANAGTDTVTAFIDPNGNNTYDPDSETQRSLNVTWTAAPPPPPPPPPTGPTAQQIAATLQQTLAHFRTLLRNKSPKLLLRKPAPHADYQALEAGTLTAKLSGQQATGRAARATALATAQVTFAAAGTKRVTLHVTKQGRRLLRRAKRIKGTLVLTFAPPSGTPATQHTTIAMKRR
jgi:hypothetical protein